MEPPYARIACCIDRDGEDDHVLREGARLAGGEAFDVVHVVAPPRSFPASPFAYVAPLVETSDTAQRWLDGIAAGYPGATPVLLDGDPAREICAWARGNGVDLIVAAARRGLVERALLGGFAAYIAYHAACSVLLVHPVSGDDPPVQAPAEGAVA